MCDVSSRVCGKEEQEVKREGREGRRVSRREREGEEGNGIK